MSPIIEYRVVDSLPGDEPVMALDDDGRIVYLLNRSHPLDVLAIALSVVSTECARTYQRRRPPIAV